MKYRKKPVVIEAKQFTRENVRGGMFIFTHNGACRTFPVQTNPADGSIHLKIDTKEGVMAADEGDWIIRGVVGEFYPCKDQIFKATYEPAE